MRKILRLLPLLLAACAGHAPRPTDHATAPPPQGLREQVIRVANGEWTAWGKLVSDGWEDTLSGGQYAKPENYQRILAYWSAVPDGSGVINQLLRRYDAMEPELLQTVALQGGNPAAGVDISFWNTPFWSAAFISSTMLTAGVPDFPLSSAHARYVDILIRRATNDPADAAFVPHDITDYVPQPGDLLCADRSAVPITTWEDRLPQAGRGRPMHCDVVVANKGGMLEVIGGNVLDAVVKRRFPTDKAGHVLQAPPDRPNFFVVFQDRLDQTDRPAIPLSATPDVAPPVGPNGPAAEPPRSTSTQVSAQPEPSTGIPTTATPASSRAAPISLPRLPPEPDPGTAPGADQPLDQSSDQQ